MWSIAPWSTLVPRRVGRKDMAVPQSCQSMRGWQDRQQFGKPRQDCALGEGAWFPTARILPKLGCVTPPPDMVKIHETVFLFTKKSSENTATAFWINGQDTRSVNYTPFGPKLVPELSGINENQWNPLISIDVLSIPGDNFVYFFPTRNFHYFQIRSKNCF